MGISIIAICRGWNREGASLKKETNPPLYMRGGLVLLICAIMMTPLVSAGEGGVNKEMDVSGTPISSISTPDVLSSGEDFSITVVLAQDAVDNGTTVSWDWQVCLNSGVCLAPVPVNMTSADGGVTWTTSMTPVDEQSYINYRITLHWEGGDNTTYPSSGFGGKVWSDCWVAGEETGGDACPKSDDSLIGFTLPLTLLTVSVAALVRTKKKL